MTTTSELFIPDNFRQRLESKEGFILPTRRVISRADTFRKRDKESQVVLLGECPGSLDELVALLSKSVDWKLKIAGIVLFAIRCTSVELSTFVAILRKAHGNKKTPAFVTESKEVYRRFLNAHSHNASDKLIATASAMGDTLAVWSCEPRLCQVNFDDIPALKKLPKKERSNFRVSDSGSRIHWDHGDVDLNLENIRYRTDAKFRKEVDAKRVREIRSIGKAIRILRRRHNLNQADCGIHEREMRRIEKGEVLPHTSTLKKIAKAHGLELSRYLSELASSR